MKEAGVMPNQDTLFKLLLEYCHRGDIEGSKQILQHAKSAGMSLTEQVYSAFILGKGRAGWVEVYMLMNTYIRTCTMRLDILACNSHMDHWTCIFMPTPFSSHHHPFFLFSPPLPFSPLLPTPSPLLPSHHLSPLPSPSLPSPSLSSLLPSPLCCVQGPWRGSLCAYNDEGEGY